MADESREYIAHCLETVGNAVLTAMEEAINQIVTEGNDCMKLALAATVIATLHKATMDAVRDHEVTHHGAIPRRDPVRQSAARFN